MQTTHNGSPGTLQHFTNLFVGETLNFSEEYDRFMRGRQLCKRRANSFSQLFILYLFVWIGFGIIRNSFNASIASVFSVSKVLTFEQGLAIFLALSVNR